MLATMTAELFQEWKTFAELEPFDNDREEYLVAHVLQILANANRNTKKRREPYSLDEVVPRFGDHPVPKPTPQTLKAKAKAIVKAMNPKKRRKA